MCVGGRGGGEEEVYVSGGVWGCTYECEIVWVVWVCGEGMKV